MCRRRHKYDLRHSFISLLIAQGATVVEVAQQAGHSATMALSTYAHLFDEHDPDRQASTEDLIRAARAATGVREVEIRYRQPVGMGQRFIPANGVERAARLLRQLAPRTDTYVGVLLRDRRAGGRDAVSRSHLVFAELDAASSEQLLARAPKAPSIVIASGTPGHLHAYWLLSEEVSAEQAQAANRKLAYRVGGDLASVDAARILRAPQTLNHKHRPAARVRLELFDEDRLYRLEELTAGLEDPVIARHAQADRQADRRSEQPARRRTPADTAVLHERLREVPTGEYVLRLTGREPDRQGKISCPFHDDRTPSLQCYQDGSWCCFGCKRGGSIYDFAGALWELNTKGREFVALRARLAEELGIAPSGHGAERPARVVDREPGRVAEGVSWRERELRAARAEANTNSRGGR